MHRRTFLIPLILLLIVAAQAQDQRSGSIRGKVYDAVTKESLIGANIVIIGTQYGAAADLDGEFAIAGVPVGSYQVQASVIGYRPLVLTDVIVGSGGQSQLEFALQPSAIDIDAVVVEADYFSKAPETPVSAQSLTYEEIRRAPGGLEDVVRAISVLPGVVQASGGRNDLIVRGGAPSENLYIIENLEVPNINHFGTQGATGGPLSFVNLDFVRDITFSTGGFASRYGDKVSSVLNIQLREGRTDRLGAKAVISASQFGMNAEGPMGNDASFLFSARRSYLDFIFKAAGFGFVPEYWDFLGKATWRIDTKNELSFFSIGTLDNIRFFNETEDQRYGNSRILGSEQNQYVSGFSLRHLVGNGFFTVALGRTFSRYGYSQADSLLRPIFASSSREGETGLRIDGTFMPAHALEFQFGAQGKLSRNEGDLLSAFNPFRPTFPSFQNAWDTTGLKAAAYAQVAWRPYSQLQLSVGGRMDYFNLIDHPVAFSPRGSISYDLTPLTSINLSAGIYRQSPSSIWLVSNSINSRLDFITATQAVLGVEHLLRQDTKIRVEGYIKKYTDYPASETRPYLVLSNSGAGFGGAEDGFASFGFDPLVSVGEGFSRGAELLVQKRLSEVPCFGIFSLAYSRTDFTALDGVERPGLYDQRVIMNLSGGYKLDERWEFSLKFRFGTGTPYTPFNDDGTQNTPFYNTGRLPVFHSLDLRVDRRWNFTNWNLIAYVDVQNVYNRKNLQDWRWDYRNRKPITEGSTIGILPTIGVSAEF
jgi:hypothetical protein